MRVPVGVRVPVGMVRVGSVPGMVVSGGVLMRPVTGRRHGLPVPVSEVAGTNVLMPWRRVRTSRVLRNCARC